MSAIQEARQAGLKTYVSGTPCPKGHVGPRYTVNGRCCQCQKEYQAALPKEIFIGRVMNSYLKNKDHHDAKSAEWRSNNKHKVRENHVRTYALKKPIRAAIETKRRARKLKATPAWLTKEHEAEILSFYKEAARLTKETGIEHHVDHIVPLQGRHVCGLHVPWNLQVLTATENLKKNNRLLTQ